MYLRGYVYRDNGKDNGNYYNLGLFRFRVKCWWTWIEGLRVRGINGLRDVENRTSAATFERFRGNLFDFANSACSKGVWWR